MVDSYNPWNAFEQGARIGTGMRRLGQERERGDAYAEGGYDAAADMAGSQGDFEAMESVRRPQRNQRRFENEQQQHVYDMLEKASPWALPVFKRVEALPFEQRAAFLNNPNIRQRFEGLRFTPEQIDTAIAALSNPETADQTLANLRSAFTQHQDPEWTLQTVPREGGGVERRPVAIGPRGDIMQGEGSLPAMPGSIEQLGSGGLWRENPNAPQGYDVLREPRAASSGGGGVQYRPVTPEEAEAYNLPNMGRGYVMGSNGRPMAATSGGGVFPAEQRARVAISLDPALEAARTIDSMEAGGYRPHHDFGAAAVDALDFGTGVLDSSARVIGGVDANPANQGDYGRYRSASSTFEASILPILSGAAVTESEARRTVRAALPQVGDSPQVLADKSRRRQQMLNGAALIGGRPPPFPNVGVPNWAARAQQPAAPEGGAGLESLTDEQLDRLEQELMNGGR